MPIPHNSYPLLPEIPYKRNSIDKRDVISILAQFMLPLELQRMTYALGYIETGGYKSMVCNNALNLQGDVGQWSPVELWKSIIVGTTVTDEHMTGSARRFLVFTTLADGLSMGAYKLKEKGIWLQEGMTIEEVGTRYWQKWVVGDDSEMPADEMKDFVQVYGYAVRDITG